MLIHYVKDNILNMMKKEIMLFILVIFVQVASVIVIFFSYGIFNHYNTKVDEVEGISLNFDMQRFENPLQDISKTRAFMNEVLPIMQMKLSFFNMLGYWEDSDGNDTNIHCTHAYADGNYKMSPILIRNYSSGLQGRLFNDDELNNGDKVYFISQKKKENNKHEIPEELTMGGEKYMMIGKHCGYSGDMIFVPILSLPKDMYVETIYFQLTKPLTENEYNAIMEIIHTYFGDEFKCSEFDGINNDSDKKVYRSLIYIAILLIIVSVVNYCIIYEYILNKRKKQLAIYRICGCKRIQAVAIYMAEMLFVSTIMLIIGQLIYMKIMFPTLKYKFEYMIHYYTMDFFVKINLIYIGIMILAYGLLVIGVVRKTPVEAVREV